MGDFRPTTGNGWSILQRGRTILAGHHHWDWLPGNATYTITTVWFNEPENCKGDGHCTVQDVLNPATKPGMSISGGFLHQEDGPADAVSVYANGGQGPDKNEHYTPMLNSHQVEVHFVLRTHGWPEPDSADFWKQLTTLNEDCKPEPECGSSQSDLFHSIHLAPPRGGVNSPVDLNWLE